MSRARAGEGVAIERVQAGAYTVPTDQPEADGTFRWDATTIIVVEVHAGGVMGLGYTYGAPAVASVVHQQLAPVVAGRDPMAIRARWADMLRHLRNIGRRDIGSMAVAAVDVALWDLKARLLDVALVTLMGQVRDSVEVYGSGGFTSYSDETLARQFDGWAEQGIRRFKMKVGTEPDRDEERVRFARGTIGPSAALFVDANGAYGRKQALHFADRFREYGVSWFEEPVTSDDREGLRLLRDRAPSGMDVTAGEYCVTPSDFKLLLDADAVDVLMPDGTRCGGYTGFLDAAALARAYHIPISAHTAPALHLHPCCATPEARHLEYFHDHARVESMLFDGVRTPDRGALTPDRSAPGHGLTFKRADAGRYAV